VIVTTNVKDFPTEALGQWNIEAKHPAKFILDQIDLDRQAVYGAIQLISDAWQRPPGIADDILNTLDRVGLVESAAALRD